MRITYANCNYDFKVRTLRGDEMMIVGCQMDGKLSYELYTEFEVCQFTFIFSEVKQFHVAVVDAPIALYSHLAKGNWKADYTIRNANCRAIQHGLGLREGLLAFAITANRQCQIFILEYHLSTSDPLSDYF